MIGHSDRLTEADLAFEAERARTRLWPAVESILEKESEEDRAAFNRRLDRHWVRLFGLLLRLYGHRYDFYWHLEQILRTMVEGWARRPLELRALDLKRERDHHWYGHESMVGGALYVDLFADNLQKLRKHIEYFKRLGLRYVHLMPLFAVRPGNNDGGYAISNYRSVNPSLGTFDDLVELARDFRREGISLVLDFVFNHTADEHEWAQRAQAGEREFQDYYFMFEDRSEPDAYDRTLREIFPTVRRGNFSWHEGTRRWVWTTFNSFQWDLNYSNPAVFRAMAAEMLYLANAGVDILRLDAVAFIWKRKGTTSENLPEAHMIIRAFNAVARIAAPGLLFKSEAIVHPDEVARYIDVDECQLSYNPTLMALLWEALATRKISLLNRSLARRHRLPVGCVWANYLRSHDDIGWTFDDADAAELGINAFDHRSFLNAFYTGQFKGSFARGVPFQYNPDTGDMRISGTMASLAGLEQALERRDEQLVDFAIRRILLLYGVILSIGGLPLLYLGEEWAVLNNYDYVKDPAKAGDSRWIHRPKMRWEYLDESTDLRAVQRRIYDSMASMIHLRKSEPAFRGVQTEAFATGSDHVLGYLRSFEGSRVLVLANFTDAPQSVDGNLLRTIGVGRFFDDLVSGQQLGTSEAVKLGPYDFVWLKRA